MEAEAATLHFAHYQPHCKNTRPHGVFVTPGRCHVGSGIEWHVCRCMLVSSARALDDVLLVLKFDSESAVEVESKLFL